MDEWQHAVLLQIFILFQENDSTNKLKEYKKKYYYGGPAGALLFMTLAPFLLLYVNFLCNQVII